MSGYERTEMAAAIFGLTTYFAAAAVPWSAGVLRLDARTHRWFKSVALGELLVAAWLSLRLRDGEPIHQSAIAYALIACILAAPLYLLPNAPWFAPWLRRVVAVLVAAAFLYHVATWIMLVLMTLGAWLPMTLVIALLSPFGWLMLGFTALLMLGYRGKPPRRRALPLALSASATIVFVVVSMHALGY